MIERVIEYLSRFEFLLDIARPVTANGRDDPIIRIQNQDHSVHACNRDVVFETSVGTMKFSDIARARARHRDNALQFAREREPLQHFVPAIAHQHARFTRPSVDPQRMKFVETSWRIAEGGDVAPLRIEMMDKARAVTVADKEISVRSDSRVCRVIFAEIRILRRHNVRTNTPQFVSIGRDDRETLPAALPDPQRRAKRRTAREC